MEKIRKAIRFYGIVQGVGFRPAMLRLANHCYVTGLVKNSSGPVFLEIQGEESAINCFFHYLDTFLPQAASIEKMEVSDIDPLREETSFAIVSSEERGIVEGVPPDLAICPDCLRELHDPNDRRFQHPFISCTNCGPRFTIIHSLPYDRLATSMNVFPLCDACTTEYSNPLDRRYHAQPLSCPECGPVVMFRRNNHSEIFREEALEVSAEVIRSGGILALKGNGGYHLACDATNESAVLELRSRKKRDGKSFAIMVADETSLLSIVEVHEKERELFHSSAAPIVLMKRKDGCRISESVAPGNDRLGVMKAYTGLHVLLLERLGIPLVMTSANLSDEPIAFKDEDAFVRLGGIADAFLYHDREIHTRMDDSVVQSVGEMSVFIRRSRGYAPRSISSSYSFSRSVLAVGGELKNVFALARGNQLVPGHHIGDLKHPEAFRSFTDGVDHFLQLYDFKPDCIAADLHPSFENTKWAIAESEKRSIPFIGVQHHHAHIVSCMTENRHAGPVIGMALDGLGFGEAGDLRGFEILLCDTRDYLRIAHLVPIYLPGGDLCTREVWRIGASLLSQAGIPDFLASMPAMKSIDPTLRKGVEFLLSKKGGGGVEASSAGRLFDGMAFLLGGPAFAMFESQVAMELESRSLQSTDPSLAALPFSFDPVSGSIDWVPTVRKAVEMLRHGIPPSHVGMAFHRGLVRILTELAIFASHKYGVKTIALSGGTFLNRILLQGMVDELSQAGLTVLHHSKLPPGDGGLAVGQAVVAHSILEDQTSCVWQFR